LREGRGEREVKKMIKVLENVCKANKDKKREKEK
jgi:hypothetical protein